MSDDLERAVSARMVQADPTPAERAGGLSDNRLRHVIERAATMAAVDPGLAALAAEYMAAGPAGHDAFVAAHPHAEMLEIGAYADAIKQARAAEGALAERRAK
jgi:hypothetical protein